MTGSLPEAGQTKWRGNTRRNPSPRARREEANQPDLGSSGPPPEAQTGMPVRSLHRGQEVNLILKSEARDLAPDRVAVRYNPRAISQYRDRACMLMSQYKNDPARLAQYTADTERNLQKVHDALRDIPSQPKPPKTTQRVNNNKGSKNKKKKKL